MSEKKIKNSEGVQQLTEKELEAINGGMKIVITEQPSLIRTFLRLIFKIKE